MRDLNPVMAGLVGFVMLCSLLVWSIVYEEPPRDQALRGQEVWSIDVNTDVDVIRCHFIGDVLMFCITIRNP